MTPLASDFLIHRALGACFEFAAPTAQRDVLSNDLPLSPGSIRFDAAGSAAALAIAPRRWLIPAPTPLLLGRLRELDDQGRGTLSDVDGKWQALDARGAESRRLLESTIDLNETLNQRGCASTVLFDCPAVIARRETGFDLWVGSSYLHSFLAAARLLGFID